MSKRNILWVGAVLKNEIISFYVKSVFTGKAICLLFLYWFRKKGERFSEVIKNNQSSNYVWCWGKCINPLVSSERAIEVRGNVGHPTVFLSSGLLVTLLHQGRGLSWKRRWQQGGEAVQSLNALTEEGRTNTGYMLMANPELCCSKNVRLETSL